MSIGLQKRKVRPTNDIDGDGVLVEFPNQLSESRQLTKPLRCIGSQQMPTEAIFANLENRP